MANQQWAAIGMAPVTPRLRPASGRAVPEDNAAPRAPGNEHSGDGGSDEGAMEARMRAVELAVARLEIKLDGLSERLEIRLYSLSAQILSLQTHMSAQFATMQGQFAFVQGLRQR
jgi:hypothetical protein